MAVDYGALKTSEAAQAKGMGIKTQTSGLAKQKRKTLSRGGTEVGMNG